MLLKHLEIEKWTPPVVYICFLLTESTPMFASVFLTDTLLFPPRFQQTSDSPSLWKASLSNPHPLFSNCMQNDVKSVRRDRFLQIKQIYTTPPFKCCHHSYKYFRNGFYVTFSNCRTVEKSLLFVQ